MTPAQIYTALVTHEGQAVRIKDLTEIKFRTLRRELHRHHSLFVGIGGTVLSLVSSLKDETATFSLRPTKKINYEIEIVPDA